MKSRYAIAVDLFGAALLLLTAFPAGAQQQCVGDGDGDSRVTIAEIVQAVGNALEGCRAPGGAVAVTGTVANAGGESVRVWASGDSGAFRATESNPSSGAFTLLLPPGDSYVMGFGRYDEPDQMHFAGHMVFACGAGEDDHFFVAAGEPSVDLGDVAVDDDGSFARCQHAPPGQLDEDGDGVPDSDDPDYMCDDVGDHNHDGFYDDDVDHDGFHDDDMDHDGHHDDGHHDHHHMGGMPQ